METNKNFTEIKISKIEIIENQDVYDITVEKNHNFFANNILVKNCGEVSLQQRSFCNLTEINVSTIENQEDLLQRVWAATVIGTIQAAYTNFHYLSKEWQDNVEEEALLGVSLTGIADVDYTKFNWKEAAEYSKKINEQYAKIIGINSAHRITNIKPSGTSGLTLGTSSGIHARHAKYYKRNIRYNKIEPIAQYLMKNHKQIVQDEIGNELNIVVSIPVKSPEGSVTRSETALQFLSRVKYFLENWIIPGHTEGPNKHNISCTINVKNGEWEKIEKWMWENKELYNGISLFPFDGGHYVQAPFEEITEEEYDNLSKLITDIDLTQVIEYADNTELREEVACSGNACEVSFL